MDHFWDYLWDHFCTVPKMVLKEWVQKTVVNNNLDLANMVFNGRLNNDRNFTVLLLKAFWAMQHTSQVQDISFLCYSIALIKVEQGNNLRDKF